MTVHLRVPGVSLVLDEDSLRVLHWGAELTEDSAASLAGFVNGTPLLPLNSGGHPGRPVLEGHRGGADFSPLFTAEGSEVEGTSVVLHARDAHARLAWRSELRLDASGLLRLRHTVRNEAAGDDGTAAGAPYALGALVPVLPLPQRATEAMDMTGRWAKEKQPQRRSLHNGAWVRECRRGRPGHDQAFLLSAGTPGFGFESGEVWSAHVAWSGNQVLFAERLPNTHTYLGGGELLLPGEVHLAAGEEYTTPWLCAAYSARGLNGISAAFHDHLRSRAHHPDTAARPRPVVLNNWEATYFDHDGERIAQLVRHAAEVGVERFVLDDGWFRHRRDDTAGLGDWYVDEGVWPDGLKPLVDQVRGAGMEFGLWFEPEMINRDSDLFRAHPEWVLHAGDRLPADWRNQQVLDLTDPGAYAYLLERIDEILTSYDIGYVKWDHNRDLVEPGGHAGRAAVHGQTRAVYRLIDELRRRHPGVEIESCSSGGARTDLGILERTDRVWTSDCNDALERQQIQRHTHLVLPLELTGSHVGPTRSHSSGRTHSLAFRATTALFGHFGVEWDISSVTQAERDELAAWIALYKEHRTLLHTGRLVHTDHPDPSGQTTAVVAADGSEALVSYAQLTATPDERPVPVRVPGLEPAARYRVELAGPTRPKKAGGGMAKAPGWFPGPVEVTGQVLAELGVDLPRLDPETAYLLHLTRV